MIIFLFVDHLSAAEKVVNSRSLIHLSDNPELAKNEDIIVTPFLLIEGRQYRPFDIDFSTFTESVTPLTWDLKRKFKTRNEIRNKLERVYYLEYFNEMSLRTKWHANDANKDNVPKIGDVVMILEDSNFKAKKRFKLAVITGLKMARDKSSNLATIHAKIVDGLGHRKVPIKPPDCNLCVKRSTCNLSTSSRNACLLERTLTKEDINSLGANDTADEAPCSSILLPKVASNK